jgi:hypothetical protein
MTEAIPNIEKKGSQPSTGEPSQSMGLRPSIPIRTPQGQTAVAVSSLNEKRLIEIKHGGSMLVPEEIAGQSAQPHLYTSVLVPPLILTARG